MAMAMVVVMRTTTTATTTTTTTTTMMTTTMTTTTTSSDKLLAPRFVYFRFGSDCNEEVARAAFSLLSFRI